MFWTSCTSPLPTKKVMHLRRKGIVPTGAVRPKHSNEENAKLDKQFNRKHIRHQRTLISGRSVLAAITTQAQCNGHSSQPHCLEIATSLLHLSLTSLITVASLSSTSLQFHKQSTYSNLQRGGVRGHSPKHKSIILFALTNNLFSHFQPLGAL